MAQLEIACFNLDSAIIAQRNGANRIELCDGFEVGGTTPSLQTVVKAKELLTIEFYVMIRPRGGNFLYSEEEFEQMKTEILQFQKLNVSGFVFGILNPNNTINKIQNIELVELAKPFPCTFHRAFDEVENVFQALEDVIACGFQTILTSGQAQNATEGMQRIAELVSKSNNRIAIMPGGGVRSSNSALIQQQTKASWFHSSAITDNTVTANPNEILALKSSLK
ncbi:copper homeostasis protein CutC [Flavobacterium wongokense]|uniref:copper homeostasis protein CutC n=1 Tax=Flavobacterium wongokense TaxID=2910674 RepID=UPI001F37F6BE|nr:copper homeostasis protein CutC [Flavobacterium sp. WG47]MCF6133301.1 copper homeostasis protein CutC [Flavobacterium sp. WG47]